MLIKAGFEFIFSFTYILTVVAFVAKEYVYDIFCFACESVSYLECFEGLHALERCSLDEVIGANGACFVAFETAGCIVFDSRKDRRHEEGFYVPSVAFSYYGYVWNCLLHAFTAV